MIITAPDFHGIHTYCTSVCKELLYHIRKFEDSLVADTTTETCGLTSSPPTPLLYFITNLKECLKQISSAVLLYGSVN